MKIKRLILALILCALLFALVGWTAGRATAPARVQWEYLNIPLNRTSEKIPDKLDEIGAQGWEMVAFYPEGGSAFAGVYVFKRQK